ncbi:reverse transcriptase [Corchorus capsularis]|uniref:Reverse transcriptase n=1 Tax=Corchorus capsularis TaxID=210143 RepID=A0A1R3GFQ3_COCAP|nr:reverse transcriptase [Corchorus capsularis]
MNTNGLVTIQQTGLAHTEEQQYESSGAGRGSRKAQGGVKDKRPVRSQLSPAQAKFFAHGSSNAVVKGGFQQNVCAGGYEDLEGYDVLASPSKILGELSADVRYRNPPDGLTNVTVVVDSQLDDAIMEDDITRSQECGDKDVYMNDSQPGRMKAWPSIMAVVEPRISGNTARKVLRRLKMPKFHVADPEGFAGGIWLCWEESVVNVDVFYSSSQLVHAHVKYGELQFLLSVVYASPVLETRRRLWALLENFAATVDRPWVMIGDFNDVTHSNEKIGGVAHSVGRCMSFTGMIANCGLIDLGFTGPSFTWCNKRKGLARVQERLDRVLANDEWRLLFPETCVRHLPRLHSDHCPILLQCEPHVVMDSSKRPFRFQAMWLMNAGCKKLVDQRWRAMSGDLFGKGVLLAEALKVWNKEDIGNLFEKKKKLRARIGGLQRSLAVQRSHQLELLEEELLKEYNLILKQEETFWAQKSRVQWIQHGERNTRFFHVSTICRRRRNKISMLRNEDGEWILEQDHVQELVVKYFQDLYTAESRDWVSLGLLEQPKISEVDSRLLCRDISAGEVRDALFQMKPWKAPGVDGFQAGFFQECWQTVGQDLVELVQSAFAVGSFNESLSQTFLVLIPKLIGPLQSSFIPGRQAADNILVAQEMIHTIRKSRGKNGLMAIKIDLEKAYDRISWDFLKETLMMFGFPQPWINLIMFCVESTSMSVLWNGEKTTDFKPGRGLRQGDPISPYLFVLCMERLGHLILKEIQQGTWKPIVMGRGGPQISHLFFANDLFLFGRATEAQAHVMRRVLDSFCSASDLGKYLDVPLIHGRVVKGTYRELVDKVSSRLNGWKSKFLSLAGRATLIGSVTSLIPTYSMLTTKIPTGIICKLDSLNRRFLRGGSETKKTLHLVQWEEVCKPKVYGGLGLRSMELHNRVLLQRTAWRFISEPNSLWVRLLKSKYGIPDDVISFVSSHGTKPVWSYSWRGLFGALKDLASGLKWRIGDGFTARFWIDRWLEKPIVDSLDEIPLYVDEDVRVKEFILASGAWNSEFLFAQLPLDVALQVLGYPLPMVDPREDSYVWAATANGKFTTRSAYSNLLNDKGVELVGDWRWIWRLSIPARWVYFIWLARRERLVTKGLRFSWGLDMDALCPLCGSAVEDVLHALRDCPAARCKQIFQDPDDVGGEGDLVRNILMTSAEVCAARLVRGASNVPMQSISWHPPDALVVKLNTDGASCGNPGIAGAGGLIRNAAGAWLVGFAAHLGVCSNIVAELQALRLGLCLAWDEGFREIECEVDAKVVLDLIKEADTAFNPLGALIADIRDLLSRDWSCSCHHTLREGNFSVDRLSKLGCSIDDDYVVYRSPPQEVLAVFQADMRGVAYPRGFKMV